ncbi:BMC domain protein [Acetobacterium paludosum]|uniref:BMC domain protein n=1 Tax=Acetobacterium paludosum TaxID=52693 RepID=A0A923KV08_9FIRM|nr:BMC domain protein [Acetobacterium paludosum]MBC3887015.1 BMC domain protein [Acetobacterium paludosum]
MKIELINGVSRGTLEITARKAADKKVAERILQNEFTAMGLCQGDVVSILVASDIAEKTSEVVVSELNGMCPQHITCLGIFGDVTSVEESLAAIESRFNKK